MVKESSEFYNALWTQWRDDLLIRHLDFHSCYDKQRYTAESTKIFETILAFNHDFCRHGITAAKIGDRFHMLQKRYETWSSIVQREGVDYIGEANTVNASEETWNNIYKEYELGYLYSNCENEHMWPELCGIFGPDSVRIARNALITPYPESKLKWKMEIVPDSDDEEEPEVDFDEEMKNLYEVTPCNANYRVPKGHICPYPGDAIMNPPELQGGNSSTSQSGAKDKKIKSKRFLHF